MFEIMCKERFKEAMELSREHRDQTFSNCMMRLLSYLTWNNADKKHCENIVKNDKRLFSDEIVNIELNLYYKSAQTLLNILVKNGYKVSCYYEEAKEKTQ